MAFPALVDDPWLNWAAHTSACLLGPLGACAPGGELPRPWYPAPSGRFTPGRTLPCCRPVAGVALGARRPWPPSCWAATPCSSLTGWRRAESGPLRQTAAPRPAACGPRRPPGRRCPDPHATDRHGSAVRRGHGGGAVASGSIRPCTVMPAESSGAGGAAGPPTAARPHDNPTGSGWLGPPGEMLAAGECCTVELDGRRLRVLPGGSGAAGRWHFSSSLAPSNRRPLRIGWSAGLCGSDASTTAGAAQELLHRSPETCGPLLAPLPASVRPPR